jgi:hypothetical protein
MQSEAAELIDELMNPIPVDLIAPSTRNEQITRFA